MKFPVDTPLVLRLDKDAYGKKPFFSWTEVFFNHAVKLHDYWFVQWVKNEPMGRQRSCTSLSGYISSRFVIGSSDFFSFSDDDFVYTDPRSLLAVNMPRSWTQRPQSARLIRLLRAPASQQFRSRSLPPSGESHASKRANWRCYKFRAVTAVRAGLPCTPMTATASAFPVWGIPCRCRARWLWLFSLREHQSRLSALADRFLFRERLRPSRPPIFFLPGTCEEKTVGQRARASSRWLRSRVPRPRHTERFLPSFFPTWPASHCKRERSGLVRGKWRRAGQWQHVTGSFGRWGAVGLGSWPRPLAFVHAQHRQSRDGCRTFPCPLKSGWKAGFGVVWPLQRSLDARTL